MRKVMTYIIGMLFLLMHIMITKYSPDLLITFSLPIIGGIFAYYYLKAVIRNQPAILERSSARRFLAIVGLIAYAYTCIYIAFNYIDKTHLILAFCLPIMAEVFTFYFARTKFEKE